MDATTDAEDIRWRNKVDDFMDMTNLRFRAMAVQHGTMERAIEQASVAVEKNTREIADLKNDIQSVVDLVRIGNNKTDEVMEMLNKNKDDILDGLSAVRLVKDGHRFAVGAAKFSKPFIALVVTVTTTVGAVVVYGKSIFAWVVTHIPGWMVPK